MKNKNSILNKITLNSSGTIFYFFCQWLITVLVVRISGYKDAGILSLIISITNIFYFIALFGVRNYQISDVTNKYTDSEYIYLRIITSFIALLLFLISLFILDIDNKTIVCSIAYIFYKLGEAFTDVLFGSLQRYNDYVSIAKSYFYKGIVSVFGFSIILYLTKDLLVAILSEVIAYFFIIIVYDKKKLSKYFAFKIGKYNVSPLMKECLPLMFYMLIIPYLNFIMRYVISTNYSQYTLGGFSSITMFFTIASTIMSSIYVSVIPEISRQYNQKQYDKTFQIIKKIAIFIVALGIVSIICAKTIGLTIFTILFGIKISEFYYLIIPTLVSSIILCFTTFFSSVIIAFGYNNKVLFYNAISAVTCSITIIPLVNQFGPVGSIYSVSIGLMVTTIMLILTLYRKLRFN